jgi:hypothetical protein
MIVERGDYATPFAAGQRGIPGAPYPRTRFNVSIALRKHAAAPHNDAA